MERRTKFLGHHVHPMLIVFPLGLLVTAVIFDIIGLISTDTRWYQVAYYLISAGLIGGLAAALFGWIDWLTIPDGSRAKRIGLLHGLGNMAVLLFFGLSWFLRRNGPAVPRTDAVVAGIAGAAIALVTGWLGGELVARLGVGVDDGAHVNALSSLSELPASLNRGGRGGLPYSGVERRRQLVVAYAGIERRRPVGGG